MALTLGAAPFGKHPAGQFNFERPEGAVIYWESWLKRFRVESGGRTLADSRGVKALHETGHLMRLYVPRRDVAMDALAASDKSTHCPHKGDATYYSFDADGKKTENIAWSYENPLEQAPPMKEYLSFDLGKVDAWFMEDEQGYAHPRDPYHRVDVHRSSRRIIARLNGEVVAETGSPAILFETGLPPRYYFAPDDVRRDRLRKSDKVSDCPYKGPGQHWHVAGRGADVENAAWSLSDPIGDAREIKDWICFYPDRVDTEVDGGAIDRN